MYYIIAILLIITGILFYRIITLLQKNTTFIKDKEVYSKEIISLQNEISELSSDEQSVNMALNIIQKNEMLEKIRRKITKYSSDYQFKNCHQELVELDRLVFDTLNLDKDRDTYKIYVEKTNQKFYSNLLTKYPKLTKNEQRLCALIRLDLSSKEIANLLNISEKSVEMNRYRLRKKIHITKSESLSQFIKSI